MSCIPNSRRDGCTGNCIEECARVSVIYPHYSRILRAIANRIYATQSRRGWSGIRPATPSRSGSLDLVRDEINKVPDRTAGKHSPVGVTAHTFGEDGGQRERVSQNEESFGVAEAARKQLDCTSMRMLVVALLLVHAAAASPTKPVWHPNPPWFTCIHWFGPDGTGIYCPLIPSKSTLHLGFYLKL